jgi:OFA family oxalate/formate antiporter-like MFS transporter
MSTGGEADGKMGSGLPDAAGSRRARGLDHGWIVVAAAFWIIALTSGSFYSYGVFFKPMLEEFGWSRQLTAGVMGLACLIYVVVLPFVGHLADRRGPRLVMAVSIALLGLGYLLGAYVRSAVELYLFVGVLGGLSYPGLLPVPVAVVSRWFDGNRGLALGITLAGVGVGTLAAPPLTALVVQGYGWRVAFLVLGSLVLLTCMPPSILFIRDPGGQGKSHAAGGQPAWPGALPVGQGGPAFTIKQALRTRAFWVLFSLYGMGIVVVGMIMIHIVPHLTDIGMPPTVAANVLGAIGVGSVIGRILAGVLADVYGARIVLVTLLIIKVVVLLSLTTATGFALAYALGFFYGVAYGGFMVIVPALTSLLFGLPAMGAIFATISIAEGIGFGLGSFLAGYVWDVTGSYSGSFLIGGLLILASIALVAFLKAPAGSVEGVRS